MRVYGSVEEGCVGGECWWLGSRTAGCPEPDRGSQEAQGSEASLAGGAGHVGVRHAERGQEPLSHRPVGPGTSPVGPVIGVQPEVDPLRGHLASRVSPLGSGRFRDGLGTPGPVASALPQIKCYRKAGGSHVGGGMSRMAKRELLVTLRDRYRSSSKKDKSEGQEPYPR